MRPRPRLEETGDEPIRGSAEGPTEQPNHQGEERRQLACYEGHRDHRADGTHEELPVRSEVDQPGAERHRETQGDEDERRGADQGL
jgi:hypothetical protein